jgi:predicted nucleotidyltransferase
MFNTETEINIHDMFRKGKSITAIQMIILEQIENNLHNFVNNQIKKTILDMITSYNVYQAPAYIEMLENINMEGLHFENEVKQYISLIKKGNNNDQDYEKIVRLLW